MFKKNITSLIYCRGNANVCCDILPYLSDTKKLDEWSWCGFVMDRLQETRKLWRHGKPFNGPLLFLLIHYVNHEGACPRFKGWTTKLLNVRQEEWKKERQEEWKKGGSGLGYTDIEKGAPDLETLLQTQTPENVDEEKNEQAGAPDLETLLQTQTPENVDEEKNEQAEEMLYDYAKTIEKLADNFKELQSKTVTLMKIMPNHEGMKKLMMECHKAFNASISSDETYVDNCQDKFFGNPSVIKVFEASTRARQTYVQMINCAYVEMGEGKDEREGKEGEEEAKEKEVGVENAVEEDDEKMEEEKDKHQSAEQQVVAGNSNNHGFADNPSWFSTKKRSRPSSDFDGKKRPVVCMDFNKGKCNRGEYCRYVHSFHEYSLQSHTPYVKTDNTSKSVTESGQILKSKRKLLVLDVNGLLAHIVSVNEVFKRPFCDEFMKFCIEKFDVGIWSSRNKKNLNQVLGNLIEDNTKDKLLFCWHQDQCTQAGQHQDHCKNKYKPLFLKELKRLWDNTEKVLPWNKGFYDESETNTILLDDSPCKALRNPLYTAVFPYTYTLNDKEEDKSLGPHGNIRSYLERLADAENVQKFIQENPLGQSAVTNSHHKYCVLPV